jgi:tRNA dimethylallyltransferase
MHALSNFGAGFREFGPYLGSDRSSPAAKSLIDQGIELMKVATRQYAKRQVSWLKNKLVPAVHAANLAERDSGGSDIISTYLLDATGIRPF